MEMLVRRYANGMARRTAFRPFGWAFWWCCVKHLQIGSLAFDEVDQMDLTGPFEVFAGFPNSTAPVHMAPVRDVPGLKLVPDAALADAPQLDVLNIPGGFGQEALMEDEEVLGWIRRQAKGAQCVFAVCTGVLICGAAGLIKGQRSHHGAT